jgi:rhamnulokinase
MTDKRRVYLAVDLGASGGRVLAGLFDGEKLAIEEVHRFENGAIHAGGRMYWDVLALWKQILGGMRAAGAAYGDQIVSVGVDTWGVDFALLGRGDELLGNPRHYRDRRTAGIFDKAFAIVSREEIFAHTGLQFIEFNTLFQLVAMKLENSPLLDAAETFLMMPDVFHWLLTGEKANEITDASTTQFYNPTTQNWATGLFEKFGLPTGMLRRLASPGENLGKLRGDAALESGLGGVDVVLPGTHDTASAVLAVPAAGEPADKPNWCYISSGTWSLMGVESPRPVVTEKCRELNFTNEAGVGGTTRLLKNIAGLWLVQECRRIWIQAGNEFDWAELVAQASASRPLASLIDPDDASFNAPRDMPEAIRDFCRQSGQPAPASEGAVIRTALESLALRYRAVLNWLEELTDSKIETIHIVGGGTQNRLLSQMAADACNRRVVAGPVEATAIGNVMMQAVSAGDVGSIREARDVIRGSFNVEQFTPQQRRPWDEAFGRFQKLLAQ